MEFPRVQQLYPKAGLPLALAGAALIPIKLAAAYAAIVPLILLYLFSRQPGKLKLPLIALPFIAFIAIAFVSCLFGIQPFRSLPKFLNLTFLSISILAYADIGRKHGVEKFLLASLWGGSVAALNAFAQGAEFGHIPRIFLGAVTQSGQLAVQIPVALGLATLFAYRELPERGPAMFGPYFRSPALIAVGLLNFTLGSLLGFSGALEFSTAGKILLTALLACAIAAAAAMARSPSRRNASLLLALIIPLLVAALLVNLKRGPWLGTFAGVSAFLLIYARNLIVPLLAAIAGALLFFEPIRVRLSQSAEHFFISGGRNVMWQIGTELTTRFPLGIGYHNSPFLRNFSVEIPPQHNHFHNNLLNVLVETGWFGLTAFIWWIGRMLTRAFGSRSWSREDILGCALGCAVLSWQIAGLVEYNFGDSEVVNLVWVVIGALVALRDPGIELCDMPVESAQSAPQS